MPGNLKAARLAEHPYLRESSQASALLKGVQEKNNSSNNLINNGENKGKTLIAYALIDYKSSPQGMNCDNISIWFKISEACFIPGVYGNVFQGIELINFKCSC